MRSLRIVAVAAACALLAWVLLRAGTPLQPPGPSAAEKTASSGASMVAGAQQSEHTGSGSGDRDSLAREPADSGDGPRLTIRVTRSDTGAVVPDLPVSLIRYDGRPPELTVLRTDARGMAELQEIAPGEVHPMPGSDVIRIRAAGPTHHELVLDPWYQVQGIVVDELGNALAGASVFVNATVPAGPAMSLMARTGADGRFGWTSWGPLQLVSAELEGFVPSPAFDVYGNPSLPPQPAVIALRRSVAGLSGTVVDTSGTPVAGARVLLRPSAPPPVDPELERDFFRTSGRQIPPREQRTDGIGQFVFRDLPAGTASLRAHKSGYSWAVQELMLAARADNVTDVRLEAPIAVRGTVTDPEGRPVQGVSLTVGLLGVPGSAMTRSARDGSYALEDLRPGRIRIRLGDPRYMPLDEELDAEPGDTLRFDPVLEPRRLHHGWLLDADGTPLEGWSVTTTSRGSAAFGVDADGRFAVSWNRALPPELLGSEPMDTRPVRYLPARPLLRDPELRDGMHVYRPVPGTEATARIRGRLLFRGGTPRLAEVTLLDEDGRRARIERADIATGSFEIAPLGPGTYTVQVGSIHLPAQDLGTYLLRAHQTLDLGGREVQAEVPLWVGLRRADGRPITTLRIHLVDGEGNERRAAYYGGEGLRVEPLLPGTYTLSAHAPDLRPETVAFELVAGQPHARDIELETGTRVTFRAVLPEGVEAPERMQLAFFDDAGRPAGGIAPRTGFLRRAGESCGFAPGSYTVRARAGVLSGTADFTVPEGGASPLEVTIALR